MHKFKTAVAIVTVAMWSSLGLINSPNLQAQSSGPGTNPVPTEGLARHIDLQSRDDAFRTAHPGTEIRTWKGVSSIYGQAFSHGPTPMISAEVFRQTVLPTLGIAADELTPFNQYQTEDMVNSNTLRLMYNRATDTYKFTAVYYQQQRGGIEVYGSRLMLLTRNQADYPIVLANVNLRDLGNFVVNPAAVARFNPAASFANASIMLGENTKILTEPRPVIWAGLDEMVVQPALALEFAAEGGDVNQGNFQVIRFITDIATGAVLYQESLIHEVDVTGNISGMATTGWGADICGGIGVSPMPYAKASIGATSVFADANGNFTIPNAGSGDVSVAAQLTGQFFDVWICNGTQVPSPQGSECSLPGPTLTQPLVTPPGPANFLFNDTNTDAFRLAEVNAYLHANVVRDYVLSYNPAYPVIGAETGFDVNVNIGLTCNAFYMPTEQSINFYEAAGPGGCTNTANSTVVHHEYGHRLVNAAGSGQGQYGEGMSDCIAVIVSDQSCLGEGFNLPCGAPSGCLRNADNDCQYSASSCTTNCGGPNHPCGRLISGCVWDTRVNLLATHPATYRDIISDLVVNSIPMHSGTGITPQITVDFLTLDDNDGNILNGTPHYNQINNAFTDHGMPGPALDVGISVSPSGSAGSFVTSGLAGGPFSPPNKVYTVQNVEATPQDYEVTVNQPWLSVSNASGTLAANASVLCDVSLNANALALPNGVYSATITFTNLTNGLGNATRTVSLEIGRIVYPATDTPKALPDLTPGVTSYVNVADSYCIGDVDVSVNITHTYIGDITVEIKSPQGTVVRLHNRTGGATDNIVKTYNDGVNTPDGPGVLANFIGQIVTGQWELKIVDLAAQDSGTLNSWELRVVPAGTICPPTASNVNLNIPVVVSTPVNLVGASSVGSMNYIIQSLPGNAVLSDPNGGVIAAAPYTLLANGNVVHVQPNVGATGNVAFTYKVNDGQDSNIATVTAAIVQPVASNVVIGVPALLTSNIPLSAVPSGPTPVNYVIMSTPVNGDLFDPNGGQIVSLPYTLLGNGSVVRYKPDAPYVGPDGFSFKISQGGQDSNIAGVAITVGGPQVIQNFNMDENPNWTISGGTWAWGQPAGLSGDPSTGKTGNNVVGYNLSGDYTNSMPERTITSGAINCANVSSVQVKFWRWLGVERVGDAGTWDHARFQASNNGTTWTTIWQNPNSNINESTWSQQTYDLSAVADGQPTLYLRWTMGTTDGSVIYHGWNIDDVEVWGIRPPCPGDVTGDGATGVPDILAVINSWGNCPPACPADIDPPGGDGTVGVPDLLIVINGWGACP